MFRFAYPEYLWLLWLLPLLVAVWTAAGQLARRRLSRFGRLETIRPLMPDASTGRRRLKFILYLTAFALLTLALARPQLGSKLREVESRGIEMMLVVDVSNSMLAEDFQPNRLERTKYAIDKLFDGLKQDRVGLVVFAGDAVVQLPITSDYRMAKAFARRISPSMVSVQGTDIGQALSLATMSFSEKGDNPAGRVIVLITDGEGHDSGAIEAAERAAEQGIRIFTIGIGTPEGAPIQIGGEFIKDDKASIAVFPEGYTSRDGKLHTFRSGVFKIAQKANVPIVVCTIQNSQYVFRNARHLKPTDVYLHLLTVIPAEEVQSSNTVELAERIHDMMAADLGE